MDKGILKSVCLYFTTVRSVARTPVCTCFVLCTVAVSNCVRMLSEVRLQISEAISRFS